MVKTKQGYMFPAQKCGNLVGVKEEFKVGFKGDITKVQATFGVDRRGYPLAPVICRDSKFISLNSFLCGNCVEFEDFNFEFDKFMRSRKPTYSLFGESMFLLCMLDGWYDKSKKQWVAEKTNLDVFLIKGCADVPNYGFNVFCNVVKTANGVNTDCVSAQMLDIWQRGILSGMPKYIQSRAEFIQKRLTNPV